jgi:thymidine phosphorylase
MAALAQEIIRIKRDGGTLDTADIAQFVQGLTDGSWSEGQAAAMAMAIFQRGMSRAECVALTRAMTASGEVLQWDAATLGGPVLDKHSTGGVGDKVSLMLAPIVAACGGFVPMVSGRGLGHTGGTLDKFDSIPGYQTAPSVALLRSAVQAAGCAVVGQTAELAPADRRLYAIRDVTATVESIPLITASILSKKLAAGLHGLAMDVKTGNGAFADTPQMAQALAESLVQVANGAGLRTTAWITDMNQVLGRNVGNALEMHEALEFLQGKSREPRLLTVTRTLCAEMLLLGRLAASQEEALARVDAALDSGAALVRALGGPADLAEQPSRHLPAAPVRRAVRAARAGWITGMDTRGIGLVLIALGGGRRKASDGIDHRVGLSDVRGVGEQVRPGDTLATVHAASDAAAEEAAARLLALVHVGDTPAAAAPVLVQHVTDGQRA